MYFVKTPKIAQSIYKDLIWNIPNNENNIYLTFDDGPTKGVTNKTLDILKSYNVKATFFCLGQQVEKNPDLFQRIISEGHSIGNHSYSHLKGWATENKEYQIDFEKGKALTKSNLFRPPYGKIKRSQIKELPKETKLILWDVLPGDFSPSNSVEKIVSNTVNTIESGSIIVLHDNDKCGEKMVKALPTIIEKLKDKNYSFLPISS